MLRIFVKIMNTRIIFSLSISSVIFINVFGYFLGPSVDKRLINDLQYSSFRDCRAFGVKIDQATITNKSMLGVPLRVISENDVSFLLFTRENLRKPQISSVNGNLRETWSNFNKTRKTVLYVHGLYQTWNLAFLYFTSVLLPREDINLILTNWESYAFYYFMYSRNVTTPILAKIVAQFAQKLINDCEVDSKMIHMMGFSAGAQAVGLAGKIIQPKVGRITAFDPQGNCFNFLSVDERISTLDADFVTIVHCTVGSHGMPLNITGNLTLYMNGGLIQPYCTVLPTTRLMADCSHAACELYLYLSLKADSPLKAFKCDRYEDYLANKCNKSDVITYTYDISTDISGLYFVNTING